MKPHLQVACAIIEDNGMVLAAQRGPHMSLPLKWEFPGGKIEAGESPHDCLRRELREELAIEVSDCRALPPHTHHYEQFCVTLHPFACRLASGTITLHEHNAVVWQPAAVLHELDWAEADLPVIDAYQRRCAVSAGPPAR